MKQTADQHILFVTNDLAYFRAHRERLASDLLRDGHRITVAAGVTEGVSMEGWPENIPVISLDLDRHHLRLMGDTKLVFRLRSLVRDLQPDVVHCITIKPILFGGLACALCAASERQKTRLVWTFAGLGKVFEQDNSFTAGLRRFIVRSCLGLVARRTDAVATFENEADRQAIVESGIISAERSHALMGTGIDLDVFARNRTAKGPPVFLFASRLIGEKGVDTYLSAAAKLRAEGANARFLLAGVFHEANPDAFDKTLLQQAARLGEIEFLGPVSQDDMPELLNSVDVFCLPTRLREGFPRSLLEAAACGAAMIATDQMPMRVLIKPGETGWLLGEASTAQLCEAMKDALRDVERTRRMGKSAHDLVHELPVDCTAVKAAFLAVYDAQVISS